MSKNDRNTYKIHCGNDMGDVHIADEVIAVIAGLAATEVEGVVSMAGNVSNEIINKLGIKSLSKGVKVEILEGTAAVSVALNLKYGCKIMEVSKKVQDKVKTAIENMTALEVADVNVRIVSVEMA